MAAPPFVVPVAGSSNFRDLGGYRTADGRQVRRGLVFRSAALGGLTQSDQAVVAALQLRMVCDFRGRDERTWSVTRIAGATVLSLPIEPTVGAGLREALHAKQASAEALLAVLRQAYRAFALTNTQQYRAMLEQLLEGGTPLLFHCTAGKDRTGFAAALLLTLLGVGWEDVLSDFTATDQLWRRDTLPSGDLPPTVREELLRADPAMLTAAFDAVREEYGSLSRYAERALALPSSRLAQLQALLLE